MNTVLITGGGGYLGSKLAEKLVTEGISLFLLDIQFNALSQRLADEYANISLEHCDIRDDVCLHALVESVKPSIVYHLAALLNRDRDFTNYEMLYEVNVRGTLNILRALQGTPTFRLVYSSSSEVYGNGTSPYREDQVPSPVSPYSLTKLMAEELIRTYGALYHIPFTVLRLFNFYGDDMPEEFFLSQLKKTLGRDEEFHMTMGEQVRDYQDIEQMIANIIKISGSEKSMNEVINICSGNGLALRDLAFAEAQKHGKIDLLKIGSIPYRENEVWKMVGDNSKMQIALSGI